MDQQTLDGQFRIQWLVSLSFHLNYVFAFVLALNKVSSKFLKM